MNMKNQIPITTFSTDDYLIPQWSSLPQYTFYFQIIKDGCLIGKVNIKKKQFSLIGRLQDLCDIYIDNPTVSRKHAILQFQKNSPYPLLYDLGNTHCTYVNKQKLSPKIYKKLEPYVNIKFGVSSRIYVLRCPQLEEKQIQQEEQKENQFIKTMNQQNRQLSKQQAKKKYLELLENDPYFGGQLASRKFQGQQKNSYKNYTQNRNPNNEGISWGISDQYEVYAYKSQKEYSIEPDIIRRLPGLDHQMLQKIAQYEQKYRIYDQIENQLNQLTGKQKRQFGLQEKLLNKKQKLQKKFVQSLQSLQKCQDWIKSHIFGEQNANINNAGKKIKKQKQRDTFSDDQFYDRTLESKNKQQNKNKAQQQKKNQKQIQQSTEEDLWQLKNKYTEQLQMKKQLLLSFNDKQKLNDKNDQQNRIRQQQQQDDFQRFMKQNNQNLQQENYLIQERQNERIQKQLSYLKQRLLIYLSKKEVQKLQTQILNPEKIKQEQSKKQKQIQKNRKNMSQTLNLLQKQQKKRRQKQQRKRKIQQSLINQQDQKIFQLYKQEALQQQKYNLRGYDQQQDEYNNYEIPKRKLIKPNQVIYSNQFKQQEHKNEQQNIIDITKRFK